MFANALENAYKKSSKEVLAPKPHIASSDDIKKMFFVLFPLFRERKQPLMNGRSSDFPFALMPSRHSVRVNKWSVAKSLSIKTTQRFTAARLFGILTRFPFNPSGQISPLGTNSWDKDSTKDDIGKENLDYFFNRLSNSRTSASRFHIPSSESTPRFRPAGSRPASSSAKSCFHSSLP